LLQCETGSAGYDHDRHPLLNCRLPSKEGTTMREDEYPQAPSWPRKLRELVDRPRQLHGTNVDAWQGIMRLALVVLMALAAVAVLRWLWPDDSLGGVKGLCGVLGTIAWVYRMIFVTTTDRRQQRRKPSPRARATRAPPISSSRESVSQPVNHRRKTLHAPETCRPAGGS
jgi:hypothetical protein